MKYKQLSLEQRYVISTLLKRNISKKEIADEMAESSIKCKITELVCRTPELGFENLIFPLVWN